MHAEAGGQHQVSSPVALYFNFYVGGLTEIAGYKPKEVCVSSVLFIDVGLKLCLGRRPPPPIW